MTHKVLATCFMFIGMATLRAPSALCEESWSVGAPMPVALGEVAGGVIGDKMYMVGQGDPATWVYDLKLNNWVRTAARPFVGNHHAAEVVGGKLYLIGGIDAGQGKVQIFDPATGTWTLGADMPFAGGSVATALIRGEIYAAGGVVGSLTDQHSTNRFAKYNPATDKWKDLSPMLHACNHAGSATDGKRMFVFGGRGGGNWPSRGFDAVQIYDPATDKWESSREASTKLSPFPQRRGGMGKAVYANGEFYVMGGETIFGGGATFWQTYDRVEIYDPVKNLWRKGPPMITARHGIFPLLYQNRIYVAGGGGHVGPGKTSVLEILSLK